MYWADGKQAQGFLSFFKTLPQDYYTAHGDNATFIAKTYYHTTTAMRHLGSGPDALSSVSISKNMLESIARDLLLERTDHTVELYQGSGSNRRLVKTGSPGNLGSFEDILFANNEMQECPVMVALLPDIHVNGCTVGLGFIDPSKRVIGLAEFIDDNHFTNVESALVGLGCKECLLSSDLAKFSESRGLQDALSRCGVMVTERKRSEFKVKDLVVDLSKLVKGSIEPVHDLVSGFELASAAVACLLNYAELLSDSSNHKKYIVKQYCLDSYMRLDSAAMKALNVLEGKTDANKNFSLFGLMNRTCTAGMGKRMLHMWLKQPLLDVSEINSRLDLVQAFVEDAELHHDLRQHLKQICDIERLSNHLQKKRAGLQHVVKLYQSSIRLPYIKSPLERYNGQFSALIKQRFEEPLARLTDEDHLNKFIALVENSVDLDQLENGEYMISCGYDARLAELKNALKVLEHQIQNLHKDTANELDLPLEKALKLEKGTQFGHVFRITKKEEPKVRAKLSAKFIVLETRKDGVKFTNTKLKRLGDQYQKILEEYKGCQKELVQKVVETAASFFEVFESLASLLSELDVLLGFADLACSCPAVYTRPEITHSDVGDIVLEGSRHPCVEAQDWVNFIPNDCKLVRGVSWFQIITGPNMGGKSTFIRQVGVNVLMAQVGSFVPCDKACISVRDCIFARVGAGDCQLRGISTFMQEMLETAAILKGATDKSLIIIDELGRGTSTYDGFGLAWAICMHIAEEIKAPTLFATHFHELTSLAHESAENKRIDGIANYHVSADIDSSSRKLTMLYKVEPGACDQSFGIHVAEFANFPASVVSLAREKAAELEDFSPATISDCPIEKFQVGEKRSREANVDDAGQGAARAHKFLKEFADLQLEKMDVKEALRHVSKMKSELEKDAVNLPWLQQFL